MTLTQKTMTLTNRDDTSVTAKKYIVIWTFGLGQEDPWHEQNTQDNPTNLLQHFKKLHQAVLMIL